MGKKSKPCGKGWKSDDGETNVSCGKHWAHPTPVHTDRDSKQRFVVVGNSLFTKSNDAEGGK